MNIFWHFKNCLMIYFKDTLSSGFIEGTTINIDIFGNTCIAFGMRCFKVLYEVGALDNLSLTAIALMPYMWEKGYQVPSSHLTLWKLVTNKCSMWEKGYQDLSSYLTLWKLLTIHAIYVREGLPSPLISSNTLEAGHQ